MKELQDIITAYEQIKPGQIAALATVVKTKGSTYRRPGARMLMSADGNIVGAISGGCLENDVFEHAKIVMATGEPMLVKYDPDVTEEIIWALGLGCNGAVYILIEPVNQQLTFIADCLRQKKSCAIPRTESFAYATVFSTAGIEAVGNHLILNEDKILINEIADATLNQAIINDAEAALAKQRSIIKTYQLETGFVEVFIEVIKPPTPLIIFGAGQDAIPVAGFAEDLGWYVTVVDHRPTYLNPKRFNATSNLIHTAPDVAHKHISLEKNTVALVMTHNYFHDREHLKMLLPSNVRYIGVLGPKSRTAQLLEDLHSQGAVYTQEQLSRLYAPVGIDIGAETPVEVALSIVTEIQAVLANRSGGLLRDRNAPIHNQFNELDV
jgi:xanthine dehydrogenase accessory factor